MDEQQQELTQDQLDERQCAERIDYWCKKLGCVLKGTAILEDGAVRIQIGVVKLPAEVRKAIKEAEKHGQPQPPAAA